MFNADSRRCLPAPRLRQAGATICVKMDFSNGHMKIKVKVIPSSSKKRIQEDHGILKVYVHSSPEKGKANKELIEMLAEYCKISKSKVTILKGLLSREKLVEITV